MTTIMSKKILFIVLYFGLFVSEGIEIIVDENTKKLLETFSEGKILLSKALNTIDEARAENDKVVQERTDNLMNFYHKMMNEVKVLVYEKMVETIEMNNTVSKYSCIAKTSNDAFVKLNETLRWVPEAGNKLKEKSLKNLNPYRLVLWSCKNFLNDYEKSKVEEMKNTETEDDVQNILNDAVGKVDVLVKTAEAVISNSESEKYRFFEEYVHFTFNAENLFKRHKMTGERKILKCLQ